MDTPQSPFLFETVSSVRRQPQKRSVPVDLATYVFKENQLAEAIARTRFGIGADVEIPKGAIDHWHLIGDAMVVGEEIAVDSRGDNGSTPDEQIFRRANDRLRAVFLNGSANGKKDRDLVAGLKPFVDERILLVSTIAEMFGLDIKVGSAIDFIKLRATVGNRIMSTLCTVFRDDEMLRKVDVLNCALIRDGKERGSDYFGIFISWLDIVRKTLPRSKLTDDFILQACRAYYGGSESGLHTGVIESGGEVATYPGSEHVGDPPTRIIENMKMLAELAAFYGSMQETELTRQIHDHLRLEPRLDGVGIFNAPEGGPNVQATDPFNLEYDEGEKCILPPKKLPLLIFEGGALRPVTAAEVTSVIVDPNTGGIIGAGSRAWAHNLTTLARLYAADEGRFDHSAVHRAISSHGITKTVMRDWVAAIVRNADDDFAAKQRREGSDSEDIGRSSTKRRQRKHALVPGGRADLAGALVEGVACEVVQRMKEKTGAGSPSTTVVDMGAIHGVPESDSGPESATGH